MPLKFNLSSKLALVSLAALTILLANLRYQQYKNQKAIQKEKQSLQDQITALNEKNKNLSDSLSYLGSGDFKDRVARQQLNLKRDGEIVFGFTDGPGAAGGGGGPAGPVLPNYEKWVEYFFGSN